MLRIKVLVVVAFCLLAVVFYGHSSVTPAVQGLTGGEPLDAPSGVSASNGDYANKVGINWDTIRGATT
ncbi:MAG: hypothetical protein HKN33_16555, partial [Pyrinomonadaceae bacterium]|nr:hypothetical protein [Pyrinomonadaceae bacterium]